MTTEVTREEAQVIEQEGYRIPDHNLLWLEEAFKKLTKKAAKLGVGKVGFEVVDTQHEAQKDGTMNVWHIIKPLGEAPTLSGWRMAATLQHEDGGNIVRSVPGIEVPGHYRTAKAHCDHCKAWRGRKDTYVVLHENGTFRQVGRNCLRDFLGGISPDDLVNYASWMTSVDELLEEAVDRRAGSGYRKPIWRELLLEHVAQVVITDGYFLGSTAAREQERESTSSKATDHMFPPNTKHFVPHTITDEARALAETATAWAEGGFGKQPGEELTEYEHNLSIVLRKSFGLDWRDVNIAASLIGAYKRYLRNMESVERKETETKKLKKSKHFGTIGKREEFELELVFRHGFDTDYGYMHIFKFMDSKGNVAVWNTGKGLNLEVGEKVKMKATIKAHDLYDSVKQTVLTRCVIC